MRRRRSSSGPASATAPADPRAVSDLTILWRVLPDLWPEGEPGLRVRVVLSLVLLVLAKAATLFIP